MAEYHIVSCSVKVHNWRYSKQWSNIFKTQVISIWFHMRSQVLLFICLLVLGTVEELKFTRPQTPLKTAVTIAEWLSQCHHRSIKSNSFLKTCFVSLISVYYNCVVNSAPSQRTCWRFNRTSFADEMWIVLD